MSLTAGVRVWLRALGQPVTTLHNLVQIPCISLGSPLQVGELNSFSCCLYSSCSMVLVIKIKFWNYYTFFRKVKVCFLDLKKASRFLLVNCKLDSHLSFWPLMFFPCQLTNLRNYTCRRKWIYSHPLSAKGRLIPGLLWILQMLGTSLVQWLRLCSQSRGLGLDPWSGN